MGTGERGYFRFRTSGRKIKIKIKLPITIEYRFDQKKKNENVMRVSNFVIKRKECETYLAFFS